MFIILTFVGALAGRFQVSKYPTLKLFRYGKLMRREYRGQRSVEALSEYVRSHLVNPVNVLNSLDDFYLTDVSCSVLFQMYFNLREICSCNVSCILQQDVVMWYMCLGNFVLVQTAVLNLLMDESQWRCLTILDLPIN